MHARHPKSLFAKNIPAPDLEGIDADSNPMVKQKWRWRLARILTVIGKMERLDMSCGELSIIYTHGDGGGIHIGQIFTRAIGGPKLPELFRLDLRWYTHGLEGFACQTRE